MLKVAIIGGGLGGLSAALRLRKYGFDVDLFEKNSNLGGKLNIYRQGNFTFDTGPSILTMPFVIDDLFSFLDKKREDYLDFVEISPIARNFFSKDIHIDTLAEVNAFKSEIAKISPNDSENLSSYLAYSQNIYEHSKDIFLFEPLHEVIQLIKEKKFPSLLNVRHIDPFRTVHQANASFFQDSNIQKVFDRYATYTGSDPYQAPAALNIIAYVELVLGGYYIKGGMYNLADALEKIALELGVKIHLNTKVDKLLHSNGKLTGIKIGNENFNYDYLVANTDVVSTFENLIDGFDAETARYKKLEPSLSGFVMLLGVNKQHDNLAHHNVFFSNDYQREFKDIFSGKILDDPTIYVAITSKTDKCHAPEGSENWFILLNVPYLNDQINWESEKEILKEKVYKKLSNFGLNIKDYVKMEKIFTPENLYKQYLSNKGSIYGISSNGKMNAFKRPANRNRKIDGLYFATGSAHPGGGIPLVILSGKHCADLIYRKNNR